MSNLADSSPMALKNLNFRPSPYETRSCRRRGHNLSQDRTLSQMLAQPVNIVQFHTFSSIRCRSSLNSSTSSITSSTASRYSLPRCLSYFNTPTLISFSSSVFFNSLPTNHVLEMTNRTNGRAESPSVFRSSLFTEEDETITEDETMQETIRPEAGGGNGDNNGGGEGGGGGGGGGDAVGWISSALIFAFWAGLVFYAFTIAPNQTQYRDTYFVEKLLNLHPDDGFSMNKILVTEWYVMGLWPVIYSSLLIPNGRSRKNGVKVWPFAVTSFFLGAFALLPYFGLWRPPPPKVSRDELSRYPLNLLESKINAVAVVIGGIVLAWYAGSAGVDQWAEFFQYFQESRFINVMTVDFLTLSALAPFWIYNDLSGRQRSKNSSWLPSCAVVPFFGPALYLLLRPALASACIIGESEEREGRNGSA